MQQGQPSKADACIGFQPFRVGGHVAELQHGRQFESFRA
jgi:hypothetical protein